MPSTTSRAGLLQAYVHNPSYPMEKSIGRKASTSRGASKRPAKKGNRRNPGTVARRNPGIGDSTKSTLGMAVTLALGAVVAEQVTRMVDKVLAKQKPLIRTVASVGIPGALGVMAARSKRPAIRNAGYGAATTSVANLASALISGVQSATANASFQANTKANGVGRLGMPSGARRALPAAGVSPVALQMARTV